MTAAWRGIGRFVLGVSLLLAIAGFPDLCSGSPLNSAPSQELFFREGKRIFDAGDLEKAQQPWAGIRSDEFYGPVVSLLLGRELLKRGAPAKAETVAREVLEKFPKSPYGKMGTEALAQALCDQGKPEGRTVLLSMMEKASESEKPGITLRLAGLERKLGNYDQAARYYRILFLNHPASVEGLRAADEIAWLVFNGKIQRMLFTESEEMDRAGRLFAKGRFDLAADAYEAVLKQKPADKAVLLKLARARFKNRDNQKAITILQELLKGDLSDHDRMEALNLLSLVFWRVDREKDFEFVANQMLEKGSPKMKQKALFHLAAFYYERGRYDRAQSYFVRLLASGPDPSTRITATWRLAWIKYHSRQYLDAANAFRSVREGPGTARVENASKYWQARSLLKIKRTSDAVPLLKEIAKNSPLDYYGFEAAARLRALGVAPDPVRKPDPPFPDVSLTPAHASQPNIAAAQKLLMLGLPEFALANLESLSYAVRSAPPVALLTAKAAHAAGKHRTALEALSGPFCGFLENPPQNAPRGFVELAFPRVHAAQTATLAKKHSLDPNLVWAIMRQESRYDATVVSPAGALGLMQVTPAAAGVTRRAGKIPASAIAEILEPGCNIAHGVRVLAKNLAGFNGKLVPAIAAYNADSRQVRAWLRRNGAMEEDVFIDNIPYFETRHYVKKVLAGYKAYQRLHGRAGLAGLW